MLRRMMTAHSIVVVVLLAMLVCQQAKADYFPLITNPFMPPWPTVDPGPVYFAAPFAIPNGGGSLGVGTQRARGLGLNNFNLLPTNAVNITTAGTILSVQGVVLNFTSLPPPPPLNFVPTMTRDKRFLLGGLNSSAILVLEDVYFNKSMPSGTPPTFIFRRDLFTPTDKTMLQTALGQNWAPSDYCDFDNNGVADEFLIGGASGKMVVAKVTWSANLSDFNPNVMTAYPITDSRVTWYNTQSQVATQKYSKPTCAGMDNVTTVVAVGFQSGYILVMSLNKPTAQWIKLQDIQIDPNLFVYTNPALGASATNNLYAAPAWTDMDNDNIPDVLAIGFKNGSMIMAFHDLSNKAGCGTLTCSLGYFQLGCVCLPCPAGTFRNSMTQQWCQVCGGVDTYCAEGAQYSNTRDVGQCTYWAPYPSTTDQTDISPIFSKDVTYYTDNYGANGGANVILGTQQINVNTFWNPASMQQEMFGGMKLWRNRQANCGNVSVSPAGYVGIPGANQTNGVFMSGPLTKPSDGYVSFQLVNQGALPVNITFNFVDNNTFFASVLTSSGLAVTKHIIQAGGTEYYQLKVQTGSIPQPMIPQNALNLTLEVIPEPYWKQQPNFESEALPSVFVTFRLQFQDATLIAIPTELSVDIETNTVQDRVIQIFSLQNFAMMLDLTLPLDDWVHAQLVSPPGDNSVGPIAKCAAQPTCQVVDQPISAFSRNLAVTFNSTGKVAGAYGSFIQINGIFIPLSLNVHGGPVNWATSTIQYQTSTGTVVPVLPPTTMDFRVNTQIGIFITARDNLGNPSETFSAGTTGGNANTVQLLVSWRFDNSTTPCPVAPDQCQGSGFAQPAGSTGTFAIRFQVQAQGVYIVEARDPLNNYIGSGLQPGIITLMNPLSITVGPRSCTDSNASPDPLGVTCLCNSGYGSTTAAQGGVATDVTCEICAAGTISQPGDTSCKPCPTGYYQDEVGKSDCKRCSSFAQAPDATKAKCTLCASYEYVNETDPEWLCRGCGENQRVRNVSDALGRAYTFPHPTIANLSVTHFYCSCNANMYWDSRQEQCIACPTGGFCVDRNENNLLPRYGYYGPLYDDAAIETAQPTTAPTAAPTPAPTPAARRILQSSATAAPTSAPVESGNPYFLKCRRADSCPGVNINDAQLSVDSDIQAALITYTLASNSSQCTVCETGYTGPLCFKCAGGYTRAGTDSCTKCLAKEAVVGLLILGAIFAIIVCVYIIRRTLANMDREEEQSDEMILLRMLMSHLQSESMVQGIDLNWPGQSAFSLDCFVDPVPVTASDCNVLTDQRLRTFFLSALFIALLPVLGLVVSSCYWIGRFVYIKTKTGKGRGRSFYQYNIVSVIIIVFLLYPSLVRTGFKFFSCSKESINGNRFVEADFNIICWSPEHLSWALTLGLIIIFVYALGVPFGFLYILKTRRADSHRYGKVFTFLYTGFKPERYYWEVVIMFRKLGIAACSIMLKPYGSDIQAFATSIVVFIAICFQLHVRPYIHADMNFVEIFGLVTVYMTLFLGLFQSSTNFNLGQNSVTNVTFGVIIILVNVAFLAFIFTKLFFVTYRASRHVGCFKAILIMLGIMEAPPASVIGGTSIRALMHGKTGARESSAMSVVDSSKVEAGNPVFTKEASTSAIPGYDDVYKKPHPETTKVASADEENVEFGKPV